MHHEEEIVPESPRHDEQPLEHVKSLHPERPVDPGKPIVDDGGYPSGHEANQGLSKV